MLTLSFQLQYNWVIINVLTDVFLIHANNGVYK